METKRDEISLFCICPTGDGWVAVQPRRVERVPSGRRRTMRLGAVAGWWNEGWSGRQQSMRCFKMGSMSS